MKKFKVLVISSNPFAFDGISNVILNLNNAMKKDEIDTHIAVWFHDKPDRLQELKQSFASVTILPSRRKQTLRYIFELFARLKKYKYQIVHLHGNSSMLLLELLIAILAGVKYRIVHSHNSTCNNVSLHKLLRPLLNRISTYRYACSNVAGEWMFGTNFTVINNGINTSNYAYDIGNRLTLRSELGIDNKLLVGHVGHYTYQKNHAFIMSILSELVANKLEIHLLLIGDGPLKAEIVEHIVQNKLQSYVTLLEKRNDVNQLLSAMDIFILPSHFEGLPLSGIEVQAAGLPCIVSTTITTELNVTKNVTYLDINNPEIWAQEISKYTSNDPGRMSRSISNMEELKAHGFDISTNASELENTYLRMVKHD